jgi:UPF0755 protein
LSDTVKPENEEQVSNMLKILIKTFLITIVIVSAIAGWFVYDYHSFLNTPMKLEQKMIFEVKKGRSIRALARELHKQKFIKSPTYFVWHAKFSGHTKRIHVGDYEIEPGTTPRKLLQMMVSGKVRLYSLTIVEGWTFKQLLEVMRKNEHLKMVISEKADEKDIMRAIGYPGVHPEGRFYPDTYRFPRGFTDIEFLQRAYKTMEKFLHEEWEKRDENLPLKTPYDALILASVIERETGVVHERRKIAGVFVRRLKKGMMLQSDPTVIYGMGDKYKGNIRRKDLRTDTPYNTYTRHGLPVTPIAMPSPEAIKAALHPEPGKTLYFVGKGDGSHYFSATLKEHVKAVREYQIKNRKKNYRSSPDKK